jgi:hypothetical protein
LTSAVWLDTFTEAAVACVVVDEVVVEVVLVEVVLVEVVLVKVGPEVRSVVTVFVVVVTSPLLLEAAVSLVSVVLVNVPRITFPVVLFAGLAEQADDKHDDAPRLRQARLAKIGDKAAFNVITISPAIAYR